MSPINSFAETTQVGGGRSSHLPISLLLQGFLSNRSSRAYKHLLLLLRKGPEAQPQHMSVITTTAVTSMPQMTVHVSDFYDDHRSLEHVVTQRNLSGQQA